MKKEYLIGALYALAVFFIFYFGEFVPLNQSGSAFLQALAAAGAVFISVAKPQFRLKLFYFAFLVLGIGALLYLLQKLMPANAFMAAALAILLVISFSYLPQIFKKGFVEKL